MAELPSYEASVVPDVVSAEDLANMDEEDQIRLAIEQSRMGSGMNNSQSTTAPKQELSYDGMTESVPQSDTTCTASGTTVIMEEDAMLREAIARSQQETHAVQGREQPSMDGYEHIDDEEEMLRLVLEQSERESRALEAKQQLEVIKDQFESLRVEEGSEEFKMLLAQSELTHDAHRVAAQRALLRQEQDEYDRTIHLSAITDKLHGVDITRDQMEKRNKWRAKFDIVDETPAQEVEDDETSFAYRDNNDNGSDTDDEIANEVSDDDWQPDADNNAIDEHIPGYMMMTPNDDVSYRDVSDRDGGGGDEHDGGDDGVRAAYLPSIPNESVADITNNNNNNNSYNNHNHNHNRNRTSTHVDQHHQHNQHSNHISHDNHPDNHNHHHNQPYMTMTPNSEVDDYLYNATASTNHDITNNNNNNYNNNYNNDNNNDNDYHNDYHNDKQTPNYYMTMTPNDQVSDNTRTSLTRVAAHGQHLGEHSAHVTQMQRDGSQEYGTITPNETIHDNTNINYALGDSSEDVNTPGYMIVEPPQTPDLESAVSPNVPSSTRNSFPKSLLLIDDDVDNVALSYSSSNTYSTLPPQDQHTSDLEQRYAHAHTRTHADGDGGVGVGSRATSNLTGTRVQVGGSSSSTNSYSIKSASNSKNDITRRSYQFDRDHPHHTGDTNPPSLTTITTTTTTRSPSTMEIMETATLTPVELKPLKSSRGKHQPSVKTQAVVNTTPLFYDDVQSFSSPSSSSRRHEKSHAHTNTHQPLESMSDDSIDTRSLLETVQTVQPVQASDHEPRTFILEKIASKKKIQTNAAGYMSRPAGGRNTSNTSLHSTNVYDSNRMHAHTHTNTQTHTNTNTHTHTLTSKPTLKPSPPKQQRLASVPIKDTRAISMAVQRGVQEAYSSTSTPTSSSTSSLQQRHVATKPSLKKAVNRASKIRRESALGDPSKRQSSQNSIGGMQVLSGTGSWN